MTSAGIHYIPGGRALSPYITPAVVANPKATVSPNALGETLQKVKDLQGKRNGMALAHNPSAGPVPAECFESCPALRSVATLALQQLGLSAEQASSTADKAVGINFFLADATGAQGYTYHTDCFDLAYQPANYTGPVVPGHTQEGLFGLIKGLLITM